LVIYSVPCYKINYFFWFRFLNPFLGTKWTSGVNFVNILQAAFMQADPESEKRQTTWLFFFHFVKSVCIKAARRMLMKLTPDFLSLRLDCRESHLTTKSKTFIDFWNQKDTCISRRPVSVKYLSKKILRDLKLFGHSNDIFLMMYNESYLHLW